MSVKRLILLYIFVLFLFVKRKKCININGEVRSDSDNNVNSEEPSTTKGKSKYLSKKFIPKKFFRKFLKKIKNKCKTPTFENAKCKNSESPKTHKKKNETKEKSPANELIKNDNEVKKILKEKGIKLFNMCKSQKQKLLKMWEKARKNKTYTKAKIITSQMKIPNKKSSQKVDSNEKVNGEDVITEKMIEESKQICNNILINPFDFTNVKNIHNSTILKLFKKPLRNKKTKGYDLFGVGEMKDVSATVFNEAINNITDMKQWNKFIKELNYVNISKKDLIQKKKKKQMLNIEDHLVKENHLNSTYDLSAKKNTKINTKEDIKFLYQVNRLPWPFKDHDIVYEKYNSYDKKKNMFIVLSKSVDDTFMKTKNITRIKNYKHFFCIYPQTNDLSKQGLKYVFYFYYNANIPNYLQIPVFRQLIPSLIFSLYAFVQKESNGEDLAALKSEVKQNNITPNEKWSKNADFLPLQKSGLKTLKDKKNDPIKKENELNENENEKENKNEKEKEKEKKNQNENENEKEKEKEKKNQNENQKKTSDSMNKSFFKKCNFQKLQNLWKNRKKKSQELFLYLYNLF